MESEQNIQPGPQGSQEELISHRELLKRAFVQGGFIAGVGLCLLTATSFLGGLGPVFDITSHFPVQYFAGLLLASGVFCALRRWKTAAGFGAAALVNLCQFAPLFFGGPSGSNPEGGSELTLMSVNVQRSNRDHALVVDAIKRASPDAFALLEVDRRWLDAMAELEKEYLYSIREPRDHNFGLALYSRTPLQNARAERFVTAGVLSIVSDIKFEGALVTVVATHPVPPSAGSSTRERNRQLAAIADFVTEQNGPTIVIGDLNTTPWNRHFKQLIRHGRLTDSAKGFGLQSTWPGSWVPKIRRKFGASPAGPPVGSPFDHFLFRIPIDHCLHSEELETVDRVVGDYVGSDHLPLTVKLRWRP